MVNKYNNSDSDEDKLTEKKVTARKYRSKKKIATEKSSVWLPSLPSSLLLPIERTNNDERYKIQVSPLLTSTPTTYSDIGIKILSLTLTTGG
jgi:hypothetical protein